MIKRVFKAFISFSTLVGLFSCGGSALLTPTIKIKVNDNVIRNEGNAGTFYLDETPTFSYELSPNTLNSDYYFSEEDTN